MYEYIEEIDEAFCQGMFELRLDLSKTGNLDDEKRLGIENWCNLQMLKIQKEYRNRRNKIKKDFAEMSDYEKSYILFD